MYTSFLSVSLCHHSELFYSGESHSLDQPQSYTCPLCGQIGFSESQLREHVTKQHSDSPNLQEVICPVCAAHPSADPNHVTDDLPTHLTVEHRALKEMDLMISLMLISVYSLYTTHTYMYVCTVVLSLVPHLLFTQRLGGQMGCNCTAHKCCRVKGPVASTRVFGTTH